MKNIFFMIIFATMNLFSMTSEEFIDIPTVNAIIGNDKFKIAQKSFTGVSGERNEEKIKFFVKEHNVELDNYSIKKYLVTNKEFLEFLNSSRYKTSYEKKESTEYKKLLNNPNHAVTHITFLEAIAYCQWYSEKTGKLYRLPTSAEWEYAAIANTKNTFPWGNEPKILPSTETNNIVIGRENFSVYQIKDDTSVLGMSNLMGGYEYTLDCYDKNFYENSPEVNPICFIPKNALCIMRGIREYNNLKNDIFTFGLYNLRGSSIDDYDGFSYFRIVEDKGTIFNKNTIDEAVYTPKIAISKDSKINLLMNASKNAITKEYECVSNVFILFSSTNEKFYRVFFQTYEENILGNICKTWKIGWIDSNTVIIVPTKWYDF